LITSFLRRKARVVQLYLFASPHPAVGGASERFLFLGKNCVEDPSFVPSRDYGGLGGRKIGIYYRSNALESSGTSPFLYTILSEVKRGEH